MMYELFYLVPTQYTDAEVTGIMEKVSAMIAKAGGEVTRNESLGRLKLAYPIKRSRHGVYVLIQFKAEPSIVNPLDRQLRLTEEILRHTLVVMPKGADKKSYTLMAYVAPLSEEGRREEISRPSRPSEKSSAFIPAKIEEMPMDVETINKKLDEILGEDLSKQA